MFHVKHSGAGLVDNMFEDMRCVITARLFREEKCFGPGIAELLEGIEELNSLRAAAMRMGMAYSKAWRIIHECEEKLGFRLLYSSTGGRGGGGAEVTPEGKKLLSRFRTLEKELNKTADTLLQAWRKEDANL